MGVERKVILTRHLATPNNRNKVIMGRSFDVDIVQDEQVGEFEHKLEKLIKDLEIETNDVAIYTSPLKRCVTTASLIKDALKSDDVPFTKLDELIETDMGNFEGQTGAELREKYPDLLDQWMHSPEHFRFPGGESYDEVSTRIDSVMGRILHMDTKFVFVCTHVDLAKMFLLKIQGRGFNERRSIDFSNGTLAVLSVKADSKGFEILSADWRG